MASAEGLGINVDGRQGGVHEEVNGLGVGANPCSKKRLGVSRGRVSYSR